MSEEKEYDSILLKIRFFCKKDGIELPRESKKAFQHGRITVGTNQLKGLHDNMESKEMFNNLEEIPEMLLKVLEKNNIIIVEKKGDTLEQIFPR